MTIARVAVPSTLGWLSAALLLVLAAPAAAQFKPGMQIVIEKPGSDRGDCGLADSPLHAVAKLALENAGAREVPDAGIVLFVHPVVIPEGRSCFVNLDVSVRAREESGFLGGFRPKEGWRAVLLCTAGVAGVADRDDVRQDVLNQVAQQIKVCLDALEF